MGIVVPISQPTNQPRSEPPLAPPPPVFLAMATAQTHEAGRLLKSQQIASTDEPQPIQIEPVQRNRIVSQKSLNDALRNAEGDEDIERITKNLERRGYDTSNIR